MTKKNARATTGYVAVLEAMEVGERHYYATTPDDFKADQKKLVRSPSQLPAHMKRRGYSCQLVVGTTRVSDDPHYLLVVERTH